MTTVRFSAPAARGLRLLLAAALLALLGACASSITAKVTSFQAWPADAAGSSFSYVAHEGRGDELEQATYRGYVGAQLERLGLKPAAAGQKGRILVDMTVSGMARERRYLEPVYHNPLMFVPPHRDAAGNVFSGFWTPDPFGPRYVGDREVTRTVQVSRLKLRLLDTQAAPADQPRAVFESKAVHEGYNGNLPDVVPYLVRAVFDGFPGANGQVRTVSFDAKTGELLAK